MAQGPRSSTSSSSSRPAVAFSVLNTQFSLSLSLYSLHSVYSVVSVLCLLRVW